MRQCLIAIFLLILRLNNSMLLPRVSEIDLYANGRQVDDINSTIEYIQQEVLNIPDDSPEDEDDDTGQQLHWSSFGCDIYELSIQQLVLLNIYNNNRGALFYNAEGKVLPGSFDIPIPPPKA
jgi:hypothetical protein